MLRGGLESLASGIWLSAWRRSESSLGILLPHLPAELQVRREAG